MSETQTISPQKVWFRSEMKKSYVNIIKIEIKFKDRI